MDEEDLEAELDQMQQEQLDEQMLNTGTIPVSDAVHRMPVAANGERESFFQAARGVGVLTTLC